jgi:hypothetical protein
VREYREGWWANRYSEPDSRLGELASFCAFALVVGHASNQRFETPHLWGVAGRCTVVIAETVLAAGWSGHVGNGVLAGGNGSR